MTESEDLLFDRAGDLGGRLLLESGFLGQRGDDALAAPGSHLPGGGAVDQEEVRGKEVLGRRSGGGPRGVDPFSPGGRVGRGGGGGSPVRRGCSCPRAGFLAWGGCRRA